jgi:hypothetical protein
MSIPPKSTMPTTILIQVEPTGRLLVNQFQVVLGSSESIQFTGPLSKMLPNGEGHEQLTYSCQVVSTDIHIRQGMTTSSWLDLRDLIGRKKMAVTNQEGAAINDVIVQQMEDRGLGALRWAVCISLSGQMELVAQFLPASATLLNSNPMLNR